MSLKRTLSFSLNGELKTLSISPTTSLLSYLRKQGLTGSKEGCGDGDCGACTVVMVCNNDQGTAEYQAVNSCLMPLGSLAGRQILSIEALDPLHPVQEAMIKTGGSQCGYCTPGFIMSMFAGYYSDTLDDASLEGNLCRCTGYVPIRKAARSLQKGAEDAYTKALVEPSLKAFAYQHEHRKFYRPTNLKDLFTIWENEPEAKLIAGGTDLGLELSHKTKDYPVLISLEALEKLLDFKDTSDALRIGAGIPLSSLEKKQLFPSLHTILLLFAARQIRNRASLGGNLATASPIGDLAPVLLAHDANLVLSSKQGNRELALKDFFIDYRKTALNPQELIQSVIVPKRPEAISQSYKVAKRSSDDISIVAASFCLNLDKRGHVRQARLAYGGVAATPVRALKVETWLEGKPWIKDTILGAKERLKSSFTPLSDLRASAQYRQLLIGNLFEKFYREHSTS